MTSFVLLQKHLHRFLQSSGPSPTDVFSSLINNFYLLFMPIMFCFRCPLLLPSITLCWYHWKYWYANTFPFHPYPLFSFGDRLLSQSSWTSIRSAGTFGVGLEVGRRGRRGRSSSHWCPWQYESLTATQWHILFSSFLFLKNHKHKVRPQRWCSWSMGNVQIFNCCVCCTLQVCSCAFSVRLPLSYVFFAFWKVQSLL